jgi:hypothetical protein
LSLSGAGGPAVGVVYLINLPVIHSTCLENKMHHFYAFCKLAAAGAAAEGMGAPRLFNAARARAELGAH